MDNPCPRPSQGLLGCWRLMPYCPYWCGDFLWPILIQNRTQLEHLTVWQAANYVKYMISQVPHPFLLQVVKPLGITSGRIPDSAINATSERGNYEARNIRSDMAVKRWTRTQTRSRTLELIAETLLSKEEKETFGESSLGTVSHPSPAIRPHCPLLAGQSGVQIHCEVQIECAVHIKCAVFSVKNKYSEQCGVYKCAVITTFLAASLPRSNNLITGSAKRVTYCPLPT